MKAAALCLSLALLSACASDGTGPEAAVAVAAEWRDIATPADRKRLHDWRAAWVKALSQARAAHRAEIAAEGALLDPDAALPAAALPAGDYACRTIKLGAKSQGLLDYVAYQPFTCRVGAADANGVRSFIKLTGSQRPMGRLFPENDRRLAFLGTLQLGDEQGVLRYGHDRERDMAAWLERIGPARWRLAFPYPAFESNLDVLELVPKS